MIQWPEDSTLTTLARANMARLKRTSISLELEDDARTWRFLAWAWSKEAPWRWILESDARRQVTVTMDADQTWTVKWADPDLAGHA